MSTLARRIGRTGINGIIGATVVGILLVVGIIGPWLTPHNPLGLDLSARLAGSSAKYLLGNDEFGRDILTRLIYGARASIMISVSTVAFALVAGLIFGVLSGYFRGWTDRVIMTFNDAMLAFPGILLALGIIAISGASRNAIILALGLAYTPAVVRVARASVLSIREREYVEASRVMGNSQVATMLHHVLPNCIAPMTVLATSMFGWVILSESALSFLGLGVPPPAPTWGNMLATGRPYITQAPHLIVLPGICISLTLLGINMLGDALRDWLDPKMQR